jgi:hypothetical protein
MRAPDEIHVWIAVGLLGSLLLGIALIPLRTVTSASNLAFAFLALTIVVAEVGGCTAALVTAVASAVSLDYFLTEPYFRLTISKPDDVVAFLALGACALIAAAFGERRGRWSALAHRAGEDLDVVKVLVWQFRNRAPLDEILAELRERFRLRAVVLRDARGEVLAAAPADWSSAPIPETRIDSDRLVPLDGSRVRFGARGVRLPPGGGLIQLRGDPGFVSLDLWEGDASGFGPIESRALAISASILALEVSHRQDGMAHWG